MRVIKVLSGQTVFDVALQELGSALGILEIAQLNGISVTGSLTPGQTLNVPDFAIEANVVADFKRNKIRPATGYHSTGAATIFYAVPEYVVNQYWK